MEAGFCAAGWGAAADVAPGADVKDLVDVGWPRELLCGARGGGVRRLRGFDARRCPPGRGRQHDPASVRDDGDGYASNFVTLAFDLAEYGDVTLAFSGRETADEPHFPRKAENLNSELGSGNDLRSLRQGIVENLDDEIGFGPVVDFDFDGVAILLSKVGFNFPDKLLKIWILKVWKISHKDRRFSKACSCGYRF